jgi:glycosyltransferase involved in cell wall biosynthesis
MKCGAPVIVSNTTSLPEVVGDAAICVDPFDINAIADALDRVCLDSLLQEQLIIKGQARASLFDWRETARRTLDVYRQVVNESSRGKLTARVN